MYNINYPNPDVWSAWTTTITTSELEWTVCDDVNACFIEIGCVWIAQCQEKQIRECDNDSGSACGCDGNILEAKCCKKEDHIETKIIYVYIYNGDWWYYFLFIGLVLFLFLNVVYLVHNNCYNFYKQKQKKKKQNKKKKKNNKKRIYIFFF
eukprot:928843_1